MNRACLAAVVIAGSIALASGTPAFAAVRCDTAAFAPGARLPEPSGTPRVAQVYALRRKPAAGAMLSVGTIYRTSAGATYYLAEAGTVPAPARAAEIAFLEAGGFSPALAQQYTHFTDIPAVPPVPHALELAARLGLIAQRCNP